MKASQIIQLSVVLAGLAYAAPKPAPNPLAETVMLSNGDTTVAVEVEAVSPVGGLHTGGEIHAGGEIVARGQILARQDSVNCRGSSRCTNNQGFKDQCARAKNKIEDTVYRTGGSKSGTCDGNCGVFIQGNGCSAGGEVLRSAYDAIRRGGCQACGSAHWNNGCYITINYVTGC